MRVQLGHSLIKNYKDHDPDNCEEHDHYDHSKLWQLTASWRAAEGENAEGWSASLPGLIDQLLTD